jgi:hypothetical protein
MRKIDGSFAQLEESYNGIRRAKALPVSEGALEWFELRKLTLASRSLRIENDTDAFMDAYEKLLIIVNPTKEKFHHTLMNETYYERYHETSCNWNPHAMFECRDSRIARRCSGVASKWIPHGRGNNERAHLLDMGTHGVPRLAREICACPASVGNGESVRPLR